MTKILEIFLKYRKKTYELRKKFEKAIVKKAIEKKSNISFKEIYKSTNQNIQKDTIRQMFYFEYSDPRFSLTLLEERYEKMF